MQAAISIRPTEASCQVVHTQFTSNLFGSKNKEDLLH